MRASRPTRKYRVGTSSCRGGYKNKVETNITAKFTGRLFKVVSWRYFPVVILILVNVVIGSRIVQDYGISWDEPSRYQVAEKSLASYLGEAKERRGSFYLAISRVGSGAWRQINPNWSAIDAWHYMNFFFYYQIAVFFFYMLCVRLANKWVASVATLLFSTQPLLWGHAFINPKDIPFTAFFIASVALGVWMVERFPLKTYEDIDRPFLKHVHQTGLIERLSSDWEKLGKNKQRWIVKILQISLGLLVVILLATPMARALIKAGIHQAYSAGPDTWSNYVFSRVAQNIEALPVDKYVEKAFALYSRVLFYYAAFTLFGVILLALPFFPTLIKWFWRHQLTSGIRVFLMSFRIGSVWAMSIFMGLANSIRVVGLAAGLLVGVYFMMKKGRKAIPVLLACFLIAFLVTYFCWPGIWGSTPNLDRIYTKTTSFSWQASVLFDGVEYPAYALPGRYLPTLLGLQFTEPALLLFMVGAGGIIYQAVKQKKIPELSLIAGLWLFAPVAGALVIQPTMYDNFRHFLFITPGIFLFACLGMQLIYEKVKTKYLALIILIALIGPNLYWNIKLHPYQYIYYNQIVGGVGGAFRRYESDYWTTSYREAIQYLNQIANPEAKIYVWGPIRVIKYYARKDLSLSGDQKNPTGSDYDYAIISTRHNKDLKEFPSAKIIFRVERDGATFAVVKQLHPE